MALPLMARTPDLTLTQGSFDLIVCVSALHCVFRSIMTVHFGKA